MFPRDRTFQLMLADGWSEDEIATSFRSLLDFLRGNPEAKPHGVGSDARFAAMVRSMATGGTTDTDTLENLFQITED